MSRLAFILLALTAAGCAPAIAPEARGTGFAPIGEGAADVLRMKARSLNAEADALRKECAALEERRTTLRREADDYRRRALDAKRSAYLSAAQKKARFGLWTDMATERDREAKACDTRLTAMAGHIQFLQLRRSEVLYEARKADDALVPAPG